MNTSMDTISMKPKLLSPQTPFQFWLKENYPGRDHFDSHAISSWNSLGDKSAWKHKSKLDKTRYENEKRIGICWKISLLYYTERLSSVRQQLVKPRPELCGGKP